MFIDMEIIGSSKEKNTVYIAVLTLAVLGIALVFSTWQILRRQKNASLEHLELTSLAVLQAVDSSLRRGPMMDISRSSQDTTDFFHDLKANGDVLFVGIIDDMGVRLSTQDETPSPSLTFPQGALAKMQSDNRWQGQALYGDKSIYIAARRIQSSTNSMHGQRMGRRMERNYGQDRSDASPNSEEANGNHHGMGNAPAAIPGWEPGHFLMVAVDMDKHFAVYQGFRRTALFQTAYTLAAAVFLWVLAVRFLSRRKLAGKAAYLERFQTRLIDSLPDGLLLVDGFGVIQAANPAAQNIFANFLAKGGANAENIASASKLAAPSLAGKMMAELSLPISASSGDGWAQATLGGMQLEIRSLLFHRDGKTEEETPSLLVIMRDRTQIRTLEKNLADAEQLAAIGSLAAGVAHEIRNPLSALRGFAQYFAKKLAGKQPEEEYAQTMVRESDRLNRVVTDLLYLARPRDLVLMSQNLDTIADEMAALLHFELREQDLTLTRDFEAQSITADQDGLKQALLNLLLNALEAMHDNKEAGRERRLMLSSRTGVHEGHPGVWVTVTDTGPGMNEQERAQAFKPFFTTKKKGTGLGLALVQATMRGHGGYAVINCPPNNNAPDNPVTGCAASLFFPDRAIEPPATGNAYTL